MDASQYIKKFKGKPISPAFEKWMDVFLSCLQKDTTILDVGSGLGYNADYMESKGFKVVRSDVSMDFIKFQKKPVIFYDVFDPPDRKFGAILMCLVVSMFSPFQVDEVFCNMSKALKVGGVLAFNVPVEWRKGDIETLLSKYKLSVRDISCDKTWWFVVAQR